MESNYCISAHQLQKKYGDFTAVDRIDFNIKKGECFGFLGPNGAGKTSTMRMLYRAANVTSGSLNILGYDAANGRNDRSIKAQLGVIPQDNNLDEELTVRDNLLTFCRFYGYYAAAANQVVNQLLSDANLVDKQHALTRNLSGGQKRRCLIARGLISSPQILILDEPTTGLDPQARLNLWDQLRKLQSQNKTLIVTTHYMDEAAYLCDRLVIMDNARIVAEGAPLALIREHFISKVVEVYFALGSVPDDIPLLLRPLVDRWERQYDRLVIYSANAEALNTQIHACGFGVRTMVREATLEDVFIKLTGRRLDD